MNRIEELGEELCLYCPWKREEIPHEADAVCEGSYCEEALWNYESENETL